MTQNNGDENDSMNDFQPLPPQVGTGPLGKAAVAASAAALNALMPGAAVPIAAGTAALQSLGDRLGKQQEARLFELLESASTETRLSPDEVIRRLTEREDLVLLTAEAIDAARRSRLSVKAAALGKSLGAIINDDALIDPESVWIRIVGSVEPPHIRILKLFLEHTATMGTGSKLWGRTVPLKISEVGEKLGLGEAVLPLVQDLLAAGLLATAGVASVDNGVPDVFGQSIHATSLGAQLFARLSVAGLELH